MPNIKICPITGKEFVGVRGRKYHPEGAKIVAERQREEWRLRNVEENRGNPEYLAKRAELSRDWRANNRDKSRTYIREYMGDYRQTPQWQRYVKQWNLKNDYYLLTRVNASHEDVIKLKESQGYSCYIMPHITEDLVIDHDHVTGELRGVICRNANIGLGLAKDNPLLLRKIAAMLETHTMKNRTKAINLILGRFPTVESLKRAADYLENPPARALKEHSNSVHASIQVHEDDDANVDWNERIFQNN